MKKIFIVPNNDAESLAIQRMLERENVEFLVTNQSWGASWDNLEPEIISVIQAGDYDELYGIELKGETTLFGEKCHNIDHHVYSGEAEYDNEQFQEIQSSLRAVSNILGIDLTTEERFFEANDTGYIPAMNKLALELSISEDETTRLISKVNADEYRAQGVTEEIIQQARASVEKAYVYDERMIWIEVSDFKAMRPVTDILYEMGKYKDMLYSCTVVSAEGESQKLVVFGKRDIVEQLKEEYTDGSWVGGSDEYGYFGIEFDTPERQAELSQEIRKNLEHRILGYERIVDKNDIVASETFTPNVHVHKINDPATFHKAVEASKVGNEHRAYLHPYELDEYADMELFLVNAGAAGVAVHDGDVVSVFKNVDMAMKDDIERINGALMLTAIKNGGIKLDCYDGFLPELYSKFGFVACAKLKFDDEFAREGWDFENIGRPDMIFMIHNGDSAEEIVERQGSEGYTPYSELAEGVPYAEDFDSAVELQNETLGRIKEEKDAEIKPPVTEFKFR